MSDDEQTPEEEPEEVGDLADPDEPAEPDDILLPGRWVRGRDRAWVDGCNKIMMEHGLVSCKGEYPKRKTAKNRVERLKELMVRLGLHEKWQLETHTERKGNGWGWHLEYRGHRDDRAEPKHPAAA